MAASKTLTPRQRRDRAVKAARARTTPDYHITSLAEVAGDLTDAQARRLVGILDLHAGLSTAPGMREAS